jgi:hypothetical protein
VAQRRQDPALDALHGGLDLGLVARLADAGRQDRHPVVLGEVLVARVEVGLVAAGTVHAALEVVEDDRPCDAADVVERPHVGTEPVGERLREARLDVGVVARAQGGDEDLGLLHFAACALDDLHREPGVVDEELLARHVLEAHHGVLPAEPGLVVATERAVLAAVGVAGLVLLPQQHPCHALAGELDLNRGEVGRRVARGRRRTWIEPGGECLVVALGGQRPPDAGGLGPAQALLHRRAGRAGRLGDLPVTPACLGLQPQHLTNLAHGQPRLRHRRPPRGNPEAVTVTGLSCQPSTGPACRGTVARHAVESRPGITWNPGPTCRGIRKLDCGARSGGHGAGLSAGAILAPGSTAVERPRISRRCGCVAGRPFTRDHVSAASVATSCCDGRAGR